MPQSLEHAMADSHLEESRKQDDQYIHFVENKDKTALTRRIQERRKQERHVLEKIEHIRHDVHLKSKLTRRLQEIHADVLVEEEHIKTVQRIVLAAMHQSAAALGAGTYGDVRKACDTLQTHPRPSPPTDYQCSDLPLGPHAPYQRVAVKTMKVAPYNDDEELDGEIAKIQHEVEMHATLSTHEHPHPNITPLLFDHEWQIGHDRRNTFFALVMPCADGTLEELIPTIQAITDLSAKHSKALSLMGDIVNGLTFMHGQGFIHCDIKPRNFLVFNEGRRQTIKITDFGFTSHKTDPICVQGSPDYLAPELFDRSYTSPLTGKRTWTAQQDWFSIGITMCQMLGIKEAALHFPISFDRPLDKDDYIACHRSYEPWAANLLNSFLVQNQKSNDRHTKGLRAWQACLLDLLEVDPAARSAAHLKIACAHGTFAIAHEHEDISAAAQTHKHNSSAKGSNKNRAQSLPQAARQQHKVAYTQWPKDAHPRKETSCSHATHSKESLVDE